MKRDRQIIVIGGGISGLCAAYWLYRENYRVTVLESQAETGGAVKTIRRDGYLIDTGPNSALETTPLFNELFDALGISDRRVYANEKSNKRYILRNGSLHPLPMSPGAFFRTKLWSTSGKLRLVKEPFIGRAVKEESIAEFVERRLGREFLDYAVNPFVAGVYAGNPEELSVRAAFPKLYRLEEVYGGLIKGMIRGKRERKRRAETSKQSARMFSFIDGMQTFPRALSETLGKNIIYSAHVRSIEKIEGTYHVNTTTPSGDKTFSCETLILSVPAYDAAPLLENIDHRIAELLNTIYYPPVAMLVSGYATRCIRQSLDGFGYLIPAREQRKVLGTIWSSAIFPARAPEGIAAFTTFAGGSRQPEIAEYPDALLAETVHNELSSILGINDNPDFYYIKRWERAIPQYRMGYGETIRQIENFEKSNEGIHICANYRGGIAVGDCVMSARKIVNKITGKNNEIS